MPGLTGRAEDVEHVESDAGTNVERSNVVEGLVGELGEVTGDDGSSEEGERNKAVVVGSLSALEAVLVLGGELALGDELASLPGHLLVSSDNFPAKVAHAAFHASSAARSTADRLCSPDQADRAHAKPSGAHRNGRNRDVRLTE